MEIDNVIKEYATELFNKNNKRIPTEILLVFIIILAYGIIKQLWRITLAKCHKK